MTSMYSAIMRRAALAAAASLPLAAQAQSRSLTTSQVIATPGGTILTPLSGIVQRADGGTRAHTNVHILVPAGSDAPGASAPSGNYETPASLACLYGAAPKVTGCNPSTLKTVATGGSRMIAIVDAYDYPTAANDLGVYSKHYGLPAVSASNFQVVYATGKKPQTDSSGGWEVEEALDIEMAHALAPNAKIVLVEAASASGSALLKAVSVAAKMVSSAGGGEVSMSWGSAEGSYETGLDPSFVANGVVFFASSGDSPGTGYPAALSNVVGVGGTTIHRSAAGDYVSETSWASAGGGKSGYIARPDYQAAVSHVVGATRGIPDIALDADPNSGAWIYDSFPYNGKALDWARVGGTSLASPAAAALVNAAGSFKASTADELTAVYASRKKAADFTDVRTGPCSNGGETTARPGYDFCTGVGTLLGSSGK